MCVCVRACARACVRVCVGPTRISLCVCVCVCEYIIMCVRAHICVRMCDKLIMLSILRNPRMNTLVRIQYLPTELYCYCAMILSRTPS